MLSNPNEDPTTKDIHEDKNDVGDEKEVLVGHISIELSKLINQFLQADDSNSIIDNYSNYCWKEEARTRTSCSVYIQKFFVKQKTL